MAVDSFIINALAGSQRVFIRGVLLQRAVLLHSSQDLKLNELHVFDRSDCILVESTDRQMISHNDSDYIVH